MAMNLYLGQVTKTRLSCYLGLCVRVCGGVLIIQIFPFRHLPSIKNYQSLITYHIR